MANVKLFDKLVKAGEVVSERCGLGIEPMNQLSLMLSSSQR